MATTTLKVTKGGKQFYEIRAARKRGESAPTMPWYVPEGWSERAIKRELAKVAAEFDLKVKAGEIVTKAERKRQEQAKLEAEAKIQTVRKFGQETYMRKKKDEHKAANTVLWHQYYLNSFIYPAIGDNKIIDVQYADVNDIMLQAQKKRYAHKTIKGLYQTLDQLFDEAFKNKLIERSPVKDLDPPKRSKNEPVKEVKPFTLEEERYLLDCLEQEPLMWQVYYNLLADTGCRRGEACAIRWCEIDLDNREIVIDSSLVYIPHKGQEDTPTKTGVVRTVYFTEKTAGLLKAWRLEQFKQGRRSDYVFIKRGGTEPINVQTPTDRLKKFGKKYGIEDCHPHRFRHTWATTAIENGIPAATVSKVLGHSDITTTLRIYTKPDKEAQKKASEALHSILRAE